MGQHIRSSFGRTLAIAVAIALVTSALSPLAAHAQAPGKTPGLPRPGAKPGANDERAPEPEKPFEGKPAVVAPAAKPSKADCEGIARVLAGKDDDAELLKKAASAQTAEARTANADLVTCMAVQADSDAPCARLDQENADNCRRDRAAFHELRQYPNGKSFMLDDRKFEECKQNAAMAPICETVRNALRSGDPKECVLTADFEAICRSDKDLDASTCAADAPRLKSLLEGHCRALVTLDEAACDVPGPRREEMAKQCRDDVKAGKAYGKGLKQMAKSGSPREQELAKAALGESDACKGLTKSAVDACLAGEPAAASGGAPAPGDAKPGTGSAPPAANPPAH